VCFLACLADEELQLEEDSMEEMRRRAQEASLQKQMETQKCEEKKRKKEERMFVHISYGHDLFLSTYSFDPFQKEE
jgi:hypothetical protein